MSTKCSLIPSKDCNLIIPQYSKHLVFNNDQPNIVLDSKFLSLKELLFDMSFWRNTIHSDYVDFRGNLQFNCLKNYNITFSFNINLYNIKQELTNQIQKIHNQLGEIDLDKLKNCEFIHKYIERSQISNLSKFMKVYDSNDYDKFELPEAFNEISLKNLPFRIEYGVNKNKYALINRDTVNTKHTYNYYRHDVNRPIITFNGMNFINIGDKYNYGNNNSYNIEDSLYEQLKVVCYLLKNQNQKKYESFLTEFEKKLIV